MTTEEIAAALSGLGPAVTFVGVAVSLGSLRLMRVRFGRWKSRLIKLLGKAEPVTVRAEPATIKVTSSGGGVKKAWRDDWITDEKIAELARRIDDLRSQLTHHQHQDLRKRLDKLAASDQHLSDVIDRQLADLQNEEMISDRWALCGLFLTGIGVLLSLTGYLLG